MKKILSLFLVLGLCFSLVGCNNSSNHDQDENKNTEATENEQKENDMITYANENDFEDAYPILSDTAFLKKISFNNSLTELGVTDIQDEDLQFLSAYEQDNNVNITYIINSNISYRLTFDKNSYSLNSIDVTTKNGRENEQAIAVAMICILDEYESLDDEEIKSIGAALKSDTSNVYKDKDDNYTISVTKSDNICSYRIYKN